MARETVFITSGASLHQTQTLHQFGLWPHQTFLSPKLLMIS